MEIAELKNNIENKNIDNSFMIWVVNDTSSRIISDQYIKLISNILNLDVKHIDSVDEIQDDSFIVDDNLYVLDVDEWSDNFEHTNLIVLCKKTKDSRAIVFPKLEEWQVVDYVIPKLLGISRDDINELAIRYNKNFYRFINDMMMISIFNKSEQNFIYRSLLHDKYFNDITNLSIWDLSNSIIKRDISSIKNILSVIDGIDVDPLGLAKVLYSNFKTIASIQMNPNVSYKDLNISEKQFFVIKKYNCWYYTNDELVEILSFLTNIEHMFKYEGINVSELIDYILINILKG